MAGPPFDIRPNDFKLSAQNVQCIHTNSRDKGTRHFNCHQNWRLGNCGYSQGISRNMKVTTDFNFFYFELYRCSASCSVRVTRAMSIYVCKCIRP